jgi:hypothetical protein
VTVGGVTGFRHSLREFVPQWLQDRPSLQNGFKFLFVWAGVCDIAMQAAIEGVRAAWPGADARVDNLPLIAKSRGLIQGETQSDDDFILDLRGFRTTWQDCGGDVGAAKRLHKWIAGNPMVRLISRSGRYTTVATDGTVTQVQAAWNWDGTSNPERNTGGEVGRYDYWIVVYPLTGYVATTGHWGDGQTGNPARGIGNTCTSPEIDTIRGLVATWFGAHINVRTLIWSYDPDAFDPATPSRFGNPDGTWGQWFNAATCLASRNRAHRYTSFGPERPS